MSRPRYAAITSSLLVRKGSARPWDFSAPDLLDFAPAEASQPRDHLDDARMEAEFAKWMEEQDAPHSVHTVAHGDEPSHRCSIKLSHAEYERLGIIAVKREITRQQALRQAVERYLAAAKRQYQARCGCLGACAEG